MGGFAGTDIKIVKMAQMNGLNQKFPPANQVKVLNDWIIRKIVKSQEKYLTNSKRDRRYWFS